MSASRYLAMSGTLARNSAVRGFWKHDAMAIVDPVAFPEYRLGDLPLLGHFRQECRFTVNHRVQKCHRVGSRSPALRRR